MTILHGLADVPGIVCNLLQSCNLRMLHPVLLIVLLPRIFAFLLRAAGGEGSLSRGCGRC
jgi:hypothetical protein